MADSEPSGLFNLLSTLFGSHQQDRGVPRLEAPPGPLPGVEMNSPEDFLRLVKGFPCPSVQSLLTNNGQNGMILKNISDMLRNSIARRSEEESLSDDTLRGLKQCYMAFMSQWPMNMTPILITQWFTVY